MLGTQRQRLSQFRLKAHRLDTGSRRADRGPPTTSTYRLLDGADYPRSHLARSPTSTKPAKCSRLHDLWTNEADPANERQFLSLIFYGVRLDDGRVVAVQPRPSFLPFFENAAKKGQEWRG